MIDPVTGWFEITQYNDNKALTITNLVGITWLVWYQRPVEIMYDQGRELLSHKFKSIIIEQEYGINMKPTSLGNPQENATI